MNPFDIDYNKINELLSMKNPHLQMYGMLNAYSQKFPDGAPNLIDHIGIIARNSLRAKDDKISFCHQALQDAIHNVGAKDLGAQFYVVSTWKIVKEYYPRGTCDGASQRGVEYFKRFVHNLKQCKDELIDSNWAVDIVECNDYLKMVLDNNPD